MTRIVRHASELDRWEMVFGAPDPRLDGYVHSYCAYDERTGSFVRRRELPSDRVVAIINLGAPIRVLTDEWSTQPDGFLAGLHDSYAVTETCGAQRGVQIDFSAVGAHLLFRLPMHELTHRVVTLEQTGPRTASRLIRAPVSVNRPASRTTGNGLSRGGVRGGGSTYTGEPAATSMIRVFTAARPRLSVARNATV